jgi:hypothetical protein
MAHGWLPRQSLWPEAKYAITAPAAAPLLLLAATVGEGAEAVVALIIVRVLCFSDRGHVRLADPNGSGSQPRAALSTPTPSLT